MAEHPPILLENLGVSFDLRRSKKRVRRSMVGKVQRLDENGKFWAVRNISLRVESGESLAVIGANGAGKSTLLKVLAGIIRPDEGKIEVRGRIATLLQLAAGFNDELNAEENILLVGEFLGIPSPEMQKKVQEILEFADIGDFAESPVSTYSSGMRARLGFAVATSVEPDVLLLDEVLSTGDAAFREKSRARIVELMNMAHAIVYVTHDLDSAAKFCTKAIEIEEGLIVAAGPAQTVIDAYLVKMGKKK
jgi:ABC-type polysaccharide/polyol phosphate transport system ATPase subunit